MFPCQFGVDAGVTSDVQRETLTYCRSLPMSKLRVVVHVLVLAAFALSARADDEKIAQDELVRRTQELFDAVAIGNQAPWKQYFAEDAVYFDEKGRSMDKTALVADVTPLPKGYSGSIKLMNAHSRMIGRTAILTYDLDETETIYGQNMTARYHGTDTWLFRDGRWQIVAGQMFRYYEDPAPGKVEIARLNDYVGTYELAPGITLTISLGGDKLYSKRGDHPQELLLPETCDLFFRPGAEGRRLFRRNDSGKVDALIDRRNNEDVVWKKL
jgi:Domain of unknown function (DUF4440)/Domain of unknown function (DUF3471)